MFYLEWQLNTLELSIAHLRGHHGNLLAPFPLPCPGIVESGASLKSEDLFERRRERRTGREQGLRASAPKAQKLPASVI